MPPPATRPPTPTPPQSYAAEQLDALQKACVMERQMLQRQHEEVAQRMEETLASLREELHGRECQVAELHMSHQVRKNRTQVLE